MSTEDSSQSIPPERADALIVVDLQRDFLPGGALGVAGGDEVVAVVNRCVERFRRAGLTIVASRDWHPADHCSFREQGGQWPAHCVAGTDGARFAAQLRLPDEVMLVSKATTAVTDAYSAFEGTTLATDLQRLGVTRLFVAGLATDYCVLNTALDARRHGFQVVLLEDAVRAVNLQPADGRRAVERMREAGCSVASSDAIVD